MPTSTVTSKGQTTVPKEVRDALDLSAGAKLSWEVRGGRVAVTTERAGLWRWEGSVKGGPDDAVEAVKQARKSRGRI
jgi:AbrB family looped-hinge helix DNA binding protein